jgi:hypothetical protein
VQRRASRPAVSEPVSERALPAIHLIDLTCVRPKQVWSGDWNGRNSLPLISSRGICEAPAPRETTEAVGKSFLVLKDGLLQWSCCAAPVTGCEQAKKKRGSPKMKPRPQVDGAGAYSSVRHLSGTTGGEI